MRIDVRRSAYLPPSSAALLGLATGRPAASHEAWLLPPSEIVRLEAAPLPELFTSPWSMGVAAAAAIVILAGALRVEPFLRTAERRWLGALPRMAAELGPLVLRLGMAIMLALAGTGGLPRHGTALWAEPTLFVPDMQLSLAPGWAWLSGVQLALALVLAAGFLTRLAGLVLAALAVAGLGAFGSSFLDYAPHFIAPGLILVILGAGRLSIDHALGSQGVMQPSHHLATAAWNSALALMGGGFIYLGLTCKLAQPALLMAILDHGGVPLFGLPLAVAALIMTVVELVAGALLAIGRLTRPVALFLTTAFTFFSVTLGENPFFHANLYGVMVILLLSGSDVPHMRGLRNVVDGGAVAG